MRMDSSLATGAYVSPVVHTFDLSVALGDETRFVADDLTIFVLIVAKHPFGTNDVVVVVGLLNQCPNLVSQSFVALHAWRLSNPDLPMLLQTS